MRETGPDLEDAMSLAPRTRTLLSWALWLGAMGCCVAGRGTTGGGVRNRASTCAESSTSHQPGPPVAAAGEAGKCELAWRAVSRSLIGRQTAFNGGTGHKRSTALNS